VSSLAIFDHIANPRVCTITLPLVNGEKKRLECVVQTITPPKIKAVFLSGQLPRQAAINLEAKCVLALDINGPTLSAFAHIDEFLDDRTIALTALETFSHVQKRDYFRIRAELPVSIEQPQTGAEKHEPVYGEAVNISGNGILLSFTEPFTRPRINQRLLLGIPLPAPAEQPLACNGIVARVETAPDGRCLVAFHLVNMKEAEQDKIIAYCLALQRQQLRMRVHILD